MAAPRFSERKVARIIDYRPIFATQYSTGEWTVERAQQCWFNFIFRRGRGGEAEVVVESPGISRFKAQTDCKLVRCRWKEACYW